ncbi:MAG: flagellar export chaperone FlgN [Planctomycetes bacterium]|nr:flagellar export chaperone FlgN [Planctomycetota bacterium]MDA0946892.1 flagellar export chaperone FlgN [Planctomycetota bacterium]
MERAALLQHLAADLREEHGQQEAIEGLLERQEQALSRRDADTLEALNSELERAFRAAEHRQTRRERLVRSLAADQGVAPGIATLGALIERLGDEGKALAEQRRELRGLCARVLQRSRKNGALIAAHRRVTGDVLAALLGDRTEREALGGGVLVDAKV